jgi:RNA polymerase sigma factor (sigma-70 family)
VPARADRLFRRYRATGDPRLLGRVFDRTAPELLRVAVHLSRDRHAAEDAVQATFLAAIEKRAQWHPARPLLPWLLAILANHCRQAFRRERRPLPPAAGDGTAGAVAGDVGDAAATAELARVCEHALDALDEPYRPVLVLHLRHGLSAHEIAATLARPDSTVRNQIARGLDLLRKKLPAGIAGAAALAASPGRGLAAVRASVLASAPPPAAMASTAGAVLGSATAFGLGGLLMAKNVLVVLLALAAVGGVGWWGAVTFATDDAPILDMEATAPLAVAAPPRQRPADGDAGTARHPVASPANAATGTVHVEVVADDGAPVPAAVCSLWTQPDVRPIACAVTDLDGVATFDAVPPGRCEVIVDAPNCRESCEAAPGVEIRVRIELRGVRSASGVVVDREGRPVGGATVRCDGDWYSTVVATSAADGRFTAPFVRGDADLWAVVPGLQPSKRQRLHVGTAPLRFVVGERAAALAGRVVDEHGAPAPGARVWIGFDTQAGSPFRQWRRHDVRADDAGRFALDWAVPGSVVVVAVPADGDLDRASWRAFQLDADGAPPAVVELELGDGGTVAGTVRDERGDALRCALDASSADVGMAPLDRRYARTDAAGAFALRGLQPGRQHCSVRRHVAGMRADTTLVVERRGRHEWNPVLADGAPIAIRVVDSAGAPVARRQLSLLRGTHTEDYGWTNDEGRRRWEHLAPGDYAVRVHGAGYAVVLAERTLTPGPDEIEIRVDTGALPSTRVSGRVVDARGEPVPGADLALYPLEGNTGFRAPQHVGADGRFRSEMLPPGKYSLSASGRGGGFGWTSRFVDLAVAQQLDLGDLVLPATASLVVRVRGPDGAAVRGATVRLEGSPEDLPKDEVDGSYRQQEVQPGKYVLQVLGAAIAPQRLELVLVPGERRELDVAAVAAVPVVLEFHFARQRPDDNGLVNAQLELCRHDGTHVMSLRRFGYFTDFAQRIDRFPIGLLPGSYRLNAKEYGGRTVDVELVVPATAPPAPLVIDMR